MSVIRTFTGGFSNEEIFSWIDDVLRANEDMAPKGIRVSNSLHARGISGRYKGVPIAVDPKLYPEDQAEVVFDSG